MNRSIDNWHCNICRACNRNPTYLCRKSCRLCSTYLFSEDKVNLYHNFFQPYRTDYAYKYPYRNTNLLYYYFDDGFRLY